MTRSILILSLLVASMSNASAFMGAGDSRLTFRRRMSSASTSSSGVDTVDVEQQQPTERLSAEAAKFKILTCASTACAKKRTMFNMDEYATFSAFFGRIQDDASQVQIEESPCLGSCKQGPCVAIEHDDYTGPVALEGMNPTEFDSRCFHSVVTEEDADHIWSCVKDAITTMVEQEEEEEY